MFCAEIRLSKILNDPILSCCGIVRAFGRFLVLHYEKVIGLSCFCRVKLFILKKFHFAFGKEKEDFEIFVQRNCEIDVLQTRTTKKKKKKEFF